MCALYACILRNQSAAEFFRSLLAILIQGYLYRRWTVAVANFGKRQVKASTNRTVGTRASPHLDQEIKG